MPYTKAELIAKIEALNTSIDALTSSDVMSYKVGDFQVSKSQYAEHLVKQRDYYQKLLDGIAEENVSAVDYDIDRFGDDNSNYIGDSD